MSNNRRIARILGAVFCANLALFGVRFWLFERTESTGILADAIHGASDAGGSLVLLVVGLWLASRPPDRKHPQGHEFFKKVAIRFVAVLIAATGGFAAYEAWDRLRSGIYPTFALISLLLFCITIVLGFLVSRYENRREQLLSSGGLLDADAQHTMSDVYASIAVAFGYGAVALGVPFLDPVAAFIVVAFIIRLSLKLTNPRLDPFLYACTGWKYALNNFRR